MSTRDLVVARSTGRCEAMVRIHRHGRDLYARCFRAPIEVHHMLTRSRGGLILDEEGEILHLIALCPKHHKVAHSPGGHEAGLMIDGYVTTGTDGRPVYQGSHRRLGERYSPVDVSDLRADLPGDLDGEELRGET